MSRDRAKVDRGFRPALTNEGALESRELMATIPSQLPAAAFRNFVFPNNSGRINQNGIPTSPKPYVQTGVALAGRTAAVIDTDGEVYAVNLTGGGTVRAQAAPGGQVDLFLYGTNSTSTLTIDPKSSPPANNSAHGFPAGSVIHDGLLQVRNVRVFSGMISQILGYRTANLHGRLDATPRFGGSGSSISRIAFDNILPGSSIYAIEDLNTLDVANTLYLNGPQDGLFIGRDFNFLSTGQDVILANGASIFAGRDLGAIDQGAKGTGPSSGGSTGIVFGDLVVGPGSTIAAGRNAYAPFTIFGGAFGVENLQPGFRRSIQLQRDGASFRPFTA